MSKLRRWGPGLVLAAVGLVLLLGGLGAGGASVVYTKAINLCLECVGIG
ncbi:MAG TPA: thioredoxin [Candidatus Flavonifractor merdigallinarum]|uniref:Thioredoxin n=1 Tax=Candidatus Flavonifractor merdigallinarum TaxID=2838589 RepID=A0A9D1Y8T6_9FIRM|nr:thioredoxin [Candidatus Flavonifractor merdigallinarum]